MVGRRSEVGDEGVRFGVSGGEEIDGLREPGEAEVERRRIGGVRGQGFQAAEEVVVEGTSDEIEVVGERAFH